MEELQGDLAAGVLPEIFQRVFVARRSGALRLAFGSETAELIFSAGYLTRAITSLPGVHLGDVLVQIGFIRGSDRDACLEIAALARQRLGETMVRHGIIDSEHLAQGLGYRALPY